MLADTPMPVGDLADRLPISRPAVSQHLKVLKNAGVVVDRQEGTRRIYTVDQAALSALRDQLDAFWRRTLAGFAELTEQTTDTQHHDDIRTDTDNERQDDE